MTIDFLKIEIRDKVTINKIKNNPLLIWNSKSENLSHFDFEQIQTKETKYYKGILFCFYSNRLEILFRPHYYFNNNEHNANDFFVKDCISVIQDFIDILEIEDFEPYKIVNLEFGFNLILNMPIENLITFIGYHGKNEFKTDTGLAYSKKCYTYNRKGIANTYKTIKAYAKGIQFPEYTDRNTFRFEVKSKKSRYINPLGIKNIADLLNPEIYNELGTKLLEEFKDVLILDNETTFVNLSEKEKDALKDYLNTHTWYKILQNKKNRNSFSNEKKKYFVLLDKTGNNIHTVLYNLISKKLDQLKESAYSPTIKNLKISAYSPIYIRENCTKEKQRICPVTKLPIDMQKKNSNLLSNTGLKHLEKTNPRQFVFIKNQLLTGSTNKYEKDVYSQISKQIRNRYFNNPNQYQGQTLF
ncbi:MAG: hypothetical protein ACQEWG_09220 [Bacteroidota bacterium]